MHAATDTNRTPRTAITDGHSAMRFGLKTFLVSEGVEVVGECATGEEATPMVQKCRPDVLVLGLNPTGETDGVQACRNVKALPEAPKVLIHTAYNFAEDVSSCFLAGADSYLHKSAGLGTLLNALRRTADGERVWMPGERVGEARSGLAETPTRERLTAREKEVLALMLRRHSNAEIAQGLFMGLQTTKNHVSSILRKFGLKSRRELYSGAHLRAA